ncbi:hypothetical protein CYY_008659 [Polysphondylium violaceum]|uniref:Histone deacetylase complex subunit SAP30 Sin3 binding domain-containing protein n=1 Tax=Polysphondylium violaceum TaxID=133409 RepID=A0A8J4PL87_9MYCE|nr:hypothetical protein CYY_008659 [Polysphondylium violaceum]
MDSGSTKVLLSSTTNVGVKRKSTNNIPSYSTSNILSNGNISYINGNNSFLGPMVSAQFNGVCTKCGGKKRHTKTCIYKRNDDDEILSTNKDVIQRLDVAALKRYKKYYKLKTKHNSSKAELASAVRTHFDCMPVNEGEIIENFMFKVKSVPNQAF